MCRVHNTFNGFIMTASHKDTQTIVSVLTTIHILSLSLYKFPAHFPLFPSNCYIDPPPQPLSNMAEEEFQESDVIFYNEDNTTNNIHSYREMSFASSNHNHVARLSHPVDLCKKPKKNKEKVISSSAPVNINISKNMYQFTDKYVYEEEEGDYEGGGEIVPPHVIVGRRIAGQMAAFSVCTGNGRTLKGRDLSQVRNSILRMTGFLET